MLSKVSERVLLENFAPIYRLNGKTAGIIGVW